MGTPESLPQPWVFANLAISVDGKIDSAFREGGGFSSRRDRDLLDAFRAEADVLVVAAATVRAEDPPLRIRDPARRKRRVAEGRSADLVVVVVSREGQIPSAARFLVDPAEARFLAVPDAVTRRQLAGLEGPLGDGTLGLLRCGAEEGMLPRLVADLRSQGHRRILLEGGGELLASFLDRGLLDELRVTVCPSLIGGRDAPTLVGGQGWRLVERKRLALHGVERHGSELYLRYLVERANKDGDPRGMAYRVSNRNHSQKRFQE